MSDRSFCCKAMHRHATHSCDQHRSVFDCPDTLIHRAQDGRHGIIVHDGGSSFIVMAFCPWCGAKLPNAEDDVGHRMIEAGEHEPMTPDEAERFDRGEGLRETARQLVQQLGWYASDEGVEMMLDKDYGPTSLEKSMIADLIVKAMESGRGTTQGDPRSIIYFAALRTWASMDESTDKAALWASVQALENAWKESR